MHKNAFIKCYTNNRDNRECCKKRGVHIIKPECLEFCSPSNDFLSVGLLDCQHVSLEISECNLEANDYTCTIA